MKYVILADNTRIDNCNDSTTSNSVFAIRDNYGDAGDVRDLFTAENATVIKVFNENDEEVTKGVDLVLLPGVKLTESEDGKIICEIDTRIKTEMEKIQDEIAELQEAIIE